MATSQNEWPAGPDRRALGVDAFEVAGVAFPGGVKAGDAAVVLGYVAEQFHRRVEALVVGWCWGWSYRDVRGSTGLSNHASGTAIDVNAPHHPLGSTGTFSATQRVEIHKILAEVGGVVRWGGDYAGRKDEMHFEINANAVAVAAVATRLSQEDDMAGEGQNILSTVLTGGPSTRAIRYDDQAGRVILPPGVDATSLIGRVSDMQWAMTKMLPEILKELKSLRGEVAQLKAGQS
jgi:hypothetical protein